MLNPWFRAKRRAISWKMKGLLEGEERGTRRRVWPVNWWPTLGSPFTISVQNSSDIRTPLIPEPHWPINYLQDNGRQAYQYLVFFCVWQKIIRDLRYSNRRRLAFRPGLAEIHTKLGLTLAGEAVLVTWWYVSSIGRRKCRQRKELQSSLAVASPFKTGVRATTSGSRTICTQKIHNWTLVPFPALAQYTHRKSINGPWCRFRLYRIWKYIIKFSVFLTSRQLF
jgi:hypothetical protein